MEAFSLLLILLISIILLYSLISNSRAVLSLFIANLLVFSAFTILYLNWKPLFFKSLYDLIFFPSDISGLRIYTTLTSAFLHIDPMHIFMNLIFLFLLGFPLEIKAGARKVIVVYLLSAIGGALLYAILSNDNVPALGASGAISGLMGALLALYPRDEIPMFLGPIFLRKVPVYLVAAIFLLTEFAYGISRTGDNVAHTAHIGGLLAGMLVGAITSKISIAPRRFRLESLRVLATTPELKEILKRMESEENEDVARAWLEEFIKEARCPRCGGELKMDGSEVFCTCGYRVRL